MEGATRNPFAIRAILSIETLRSDLSTPLMRKVGYGKGYRYAHDYEEAQVEQQHLPDAIKDRTYYHPSDRGYEKTVKDRLDAFEAARRKTRKAGRAD